MAPKAAAKKAAPQGYIQNLRAPVETRVGAAPNVKVHTVEWNKVLNGEPVEINPSLGNGMKIMTIEEWAARWKRNEDLPDCLACGSLNTKEHAFTQRWCRGKKQWDSDLLCMDCHLFSQRKYSDPDFLTPEDYEKVEWETKIKAAQAGKPGITA
eukprot:jgi/Tetstr1/425801/TSEL_001584.t1